ncbi:fructosamine kinase family protein [Butyrivibrio sp. AC2005]|uniref:fructosamine kinase family protein n=1 Tax=Butyrivibrio sp. AC2005 TaxID=1280672 RepID=UPI0003FC684E|nr:fructosamine kinase family protein [Butyrivibrio sp. AC2005]
METTSENRYISNSLKEALASIYGQAVTVLAKSAVHGGDANDAYILRLSNGKNVFQKENIAMTELFGGFDNRFYDAYFETFGVTPGYEDRRDIYNLYHLTNHLNLFGISYLSAVARIIYRYQ